MIYFVIAVCVAILVVIIVNRKDNQSSGGRFAKNKTYTKNDPLVQRINANLKERHDTSPHSGGSPQNHLLARASAAAASAKAGGNIGYIAQNVATIYHCICRYADKGNKYTTAQRIYAALLIDSIAYLQNGQISSSELQTSVHAAAVHQIGANHFYHQEVYGIACYPDNADLICATADLEVLMFCADSNLDYHSVIDFVARSIGAIESMVHRTLSQGDASPLFDNILPTVLALFHQQDFLSELDVIDF